MSPSSLDQNARRVRLAEAVRLRDLGWPYAMIADRLGYSSEDVVSKDVSRARAAARKRQAAEEAAALEQAREAASVLRARVERAGERAFLSGLLPVLQDGLDAPRKTDALNALARLYGRVSGRLRELDQRDDHDDLDALRTAGASARQGSTLD
jgi:hypothetical protein